MVSLTLCTALWLCSITVFATSSFHDNLTDISLSAGDGEILSKRALANGVQLRILPLGASIVWGYLSPSGNGFRYPLRNQLVFDGNPVNMVGSISTGSMADGQCECYQGAVINDIYAKADNAIPSQPNVVLVHVGTNDMNQNIDLPNAHLRLAALWDKLFAAIPGVTIIASTLLPTSSVSGAQARVDYYNNKIPGEVKARQDAGKKITYVDFSSGWITLADLVDGTHPTETGYEKMAAVWHQGIVAAANQGWITAPNTVAGLDDTVKGSNTCDKIPGNAIGPYQTQMGSGYDDGPYVHASTQVSTIRGYDNPASLPYNNPFPEGVYWADINGDGIDDYVYVGNQAMDGIGVALSTGGGNLGPYLNSALPFSCLRRGVRFADMTGDGRDDFCCIAPSGDMNCLQNTLGADPRSPKWVDMGRVKNGECLQPYVRLADIDGDGREDYVCFSVDGSEVYGWRNGATTHTGPAYWTPMKGVAHGLPVLELSGWRFVDLNGDRRDDLIWVSKNGQVSTWINKRGKALGLTPAWEYMGVTHAGGSAPRNVTFGKFMGSGRGDYSSLSIDPAGGNVIIDRWRNEDHGGTMSKSDGSRYCDMTGDGSDDYIYINTMGDMEIFGNRHSWGSWDQYGHVYNINRARRDIHFADFDGDGKCDILLVDKASGATTMLRNDFANGKFAFTNIGIVTGTATCTHGYGYDLHDNGVRWNDIDGDGRADFLCMELNGRITGYLNKGIGNMENRGQIKQPEGRERKNLRLADINGDGRVDMVWVSIIDGSAYLYQNKGPGSASGSSFVWEQKGVIATGGSARGSAIEFPNMNGIGRADYLYMDPAVNTAWVYLNVCPQGGLAPVQPNLPQGAPPAPVPGSPLPTTPPVTLPSYPNGGYQYGNIFLEHSSSYVPNSDGLDGNRDWCDNVSYEDQKTLNGGPYQIERSKGASDLGWMSVRCSIPEIKNEKNSYSPAERWYAADAQNALAAYRTCWTGWYSFEDTKNNPRQTWSKGLSQYFGFGATQDCENFAVPETCTTPVLCASDEDSPGGGPAGMLIMNSLINLHGLHVVIHDAIKDVLIRETTFKMGTALATFSPNIEKDQSKWYNILLDIIGIGFAVAAAPLWNNILTTLPRFANKPSLLGNIKDSTNGIVAGGLSIIKTVITPAESESEAQAQLAYMAGQLQDTWLNASAAGLRETMSMQLTYDPTTGVYDQHSWETFFDLVDEGKLLDTSGFTTTSINETIKSAFWATLIPWAWSLSNTEVHPFILIPENQHIGCTDIDVDQWIAEENQPLSLSCLDLWPYYLASAGDGCTQCNQDILENNHGIVLVPKKFPMPPGITNLQEPDPSDANKNPWGVTRHQMVKSSVASYQANGGNGFKPVWQGTGIKFDSFVEDALEAVGVFTFPVCTGSEAWANWGKNGWKDNPNYPCNP